MAGEFNIVVERCFDIKHEIEKVAVSHRKKIKDLVFDLIDVYLLYSADGEYFDRVLSDDLDRFMSSDELYGNPEVKIKQCYDIAIRDFEEGDESFFDMEFDKDKYRLFISVDDTSKLKENIQNTMRHINRKRAMMGIVFAHQFRLNDIDYLVSAIDNAQDFIVNTKKVLIQESEVYTPLIDGYIDFIPKLNWEKKNQKTLDNASFGVVEGDLVGVVYETKDGVSGRDLCGEYIKLSDKEPVELKIEYLSGDFSEEQFDEYKLFRSSKNGYVGLSGKSLVLIKQTSLNFEEINSRNVGNLVGGVECEFEINVRCNNDQIDAIGQSIHLEAFRVNIKGNVGEHAYIKCVECSVDGNTHQSSQIYATNAKLSTHKGLLVANRAEIDYLEMGVVDCDSANLACVCGGEIRGNSIDIKTLRQNSKISIVKKLHIEKMEGGNNTIVIDSASYFENKEAISAIELRAKKYIDKAKILGRNLKKESAHALKLKPMIVKLKEIYVKSTQSGSKVPPYIADNISDYLTLVKKINKLKGAIFVLQREANKIRSAIEELDHSALGASVVLDSFWVKQNQIEYVNNFKNIKDYALVENKENVRIRIDSVALKIVKERVKK